MELGFFDNHQIDEYSWLLRMQMHQASLAIIAFAVLEGASTECFKTTYSLSIQVLAARLVLLCTRFEVYK